MPSFLHYTSPDAALCTVGVAAFSGSLSALPGMRTTPPPWVRYGLGLGPGVRVGVGVGVGARGWSWGEGLELGLVSGLIKLGLGFGLRVGSGLRLGLRVELRLGFGPFIFTATGERSIGAPGSSPSCPPCSQGQG